MITTSATPSYGCLPPTEPRSSNPTNADTTMQGGQAVFENDNYRITMGDNNTVTINNKHTGESYQAWGDPHMNVDGQHAFDFWGTTTLKLEDGTKVTIETTPAKDHPGQTLSSKVTITNGDYGVQVTGIDTNKTGDLKVKETEDWGRTLDWAVDDGNKIQENPAGQGFLAVDRGGNIRKVDQQYINATDEMKGGAQGKGGAEGNGGIERLADLFKDAFRQLSTLQSIHCLGRFLNGPDGGNGGGQAGRNDDQPSRNDDRPAVRHGDRHHGRHLDLSLNLSLTLHAFG